MTQARVALSKEFMESYSRLPRTTQKKVREFTEKFQRDPTQSGIRFERIGHARDPKVRSVRIDQTYRAIVIQPPRGDVFLCVWVDHHDEAYRWAMDRLFEVNPRSGSFQIFTSEEAITAPAPGDAPSVADTPSRQPEVMVATTEAEVPDAEGLFAANDDEELLLAGVPMPLLASVRAIRTEADLDALAPHLPSEAAELLFLLAAGYGLLEAIDESERSRPDPATVDPEDFEAALALPESRQRFRVVEDEADLTAMLEAPLEQWRIFLHPSQRKLVRMKANGPVRVLGGAGTGKTVVLMHRANHLASKVFTGEGDRILVTTFTQNLAFDLRMNLRNLCRPEDFERLEVTNLHSWIAGFMRGQGHTFDIVPEPERARLFELAAAEAAEVDFPPSFYQDEWDQVVQAREVSGRDEYLTVSRAGRGSRISRRQRFRVWEVLQRYRELLDEAGRIEWPDMVRETRLYLEKNRIPSPYRAVLCDEVQDLSAGDLRLLRLLAPQAGDSLFLVGDGHQRIYGRPVPLSACGIEIRGRSRRLKLNYRTTEEIRKRAVAILEGMTIDDLDGGVDSLKGFRSLRSGRKPELAHFETETAEAAFLIEKIKKWLEDGTPSETICLAARTNAQLRDRYEAMLNAHGIGTLRVETDPETESAKPGIRLATMHRMKGLEFSRVILAGVREGGDSWWGEGSGNPDSGEVDDDLNERCLFYVASTRARDELVIVGFCKKFIPRTEHRTGQSPSTGPDLCRLHEDGLQKPEEGRGTGVG